MRSHLTYLLAIGTALGAAPAAAEEAPQDASADAATDGAIHAILIGVGDYLYLDADLKGPPNDARLMAETLAGRGVPAAAMTVLTTDPAGLPEGAGIAAPDRATILATLAETSVKAAPGDTVFFYFSGHGSQAPDQNGDEGGGYDEIFLPMDARDWKGEIGMVENAIVDDELQLWAQDLLARGVRLVGVIDACHSATGFRAIGEEPGAGVARSLSPDQLGIPEDLPPVPFTGAAELSGDFVFLYSSQADERSFEYPLGDTGIWHGEFTLRLAQVMALAPEASWAQVLAATSDAMIEGPARQLPDGEGPLLTASVFGAGSGAARLRLDGQSVKAGLLQGLAEGSELTLYSAGAGGEALGTVLVGKVSAREAMIDAPLPEGAAWAELTGSPEPEALRLAPPRRFDPADGHDYASWEAALAAAAEGTGAGSGKTADLVPVLIEGGLALAGADGVLDPDGPGSSLRVLPVEGESDAAALARVTENIAWGRRLQDVLSRAAGRGLTRAEVIEVAIERRPGEVAEGACTGKAGPGAPHDPAQGVSGCDQLWLTLTNRSGKSQDVSVLYMAADFGIQPIWPGDNMVNRLGPGESARVGLQIDPITRPGFEEIWILAVPMTDARAPRADLTSIALLPGRRAGPDAAGSAPDSAMAEWLDGRLAPPDDETTMRGFSMKPADLTMIRRIVRLEPGVE